MKYKCVETFTVPMLDEVGGNEIDEELTVLEGSVWESKERVSLRDSEVRLTHNDGSWLKLTKELFNLMFEEVN